MNHCIPVQFLVFGLTVISLAGDATAQAPRPERPFQGRVEAVWDNVFLGLVAPPARFVGISQVSHMGRSTQAGTLTLSPPNMFGIAPGIGSVTITAANGDTLSFDYTGGLNAVTGEGLGTFIFTGGTGRFAGATGSGTFRALINLNFSVNQPMTVVLDGRIRY